MDKIKLPKLHLICANNVNTIQEYILITKDEIVASDSHILTILKTKDIFSDEFIEAMPKRFLVHKSQWKNFYNGAFDFTFKDNSICVHYNGYEVYHEIKTEDDNLNYPNYNAIIPKQETEVLCEIGIDPFLLKNLAESMTFDSNKKTVKLQFFGVNKAILVTPINHNYNSKGIIMPIKIID